MIRKYTGSKTFSMEFMMYYVLCIMSVVIKWLITEHSFWNTNEARNNVLQDERICSQLHEWQDFTLLNAPKYPTAEKTVHSSVQLRVWLPEWPSNNGFEGGKKELYSKRGIVAHRGKNIRTVRLVCGKNKHNLTKRTLLYYVCYVCCTMSSTVCVPLILLVAIVITVISGRSNKRCR